MDFLKKRVITNLDWLARYLSNKYDIEIFPSQLNQMLVELNSEDFIEKITVGEEELSITIKYRDSTKYDECMLLLEPFIKATGLDQKDIKGLGDVRNSVLRAQWVDNSAKAEEKLWRALERIQFNEEKSLLYLLTEDLRLVENFRTSLFTFVIRDWKKTSIYPANER